MRIKKIGIRMRSICLVLFTLTALGVLSAQQVDSLFEPGLDKSSLSIATVAVVPNRLPLVLQEADYWREYNWRVIASILEANGYVVIPYEESLAIANETGLPLEDAAGAGEKYESFCQASGAELVIVPYYGTAFRLTPTFVIVSRLTYTSTVSFQLFSPSTGTFFYRGDASASVDKYSGLGTSIGLAANIGLGLFGDSTLSAIGGAAVGIGAVYDVVQSLQPPERMWERAFAEAVEDALIPVISTFSSFGYIPPSELPASPRPMFAEAIPEKPRSKFFLEASAYDYVFNGVNACLVGGNVNLLFRVSEKATMGFGIGLERMAMDTGDETSDGISILDPSLGYDDGLDLNINFVPLLLGDIQELGGGLGLVIKTNDWWTPAIWPKLMVYFKGFSCSMVPAFVTIPDSILLEFGYALGL